MSKSDSKNSLLHLYHLHLEKYNLSPDALQIQVLSDLQDLYDQFSIPKKRKQKPFNLFSKLNSKKTRAISLGTYLWGSVGCGKTFVLNLFFESVPTTRKKRIHFHQFMCEVHNQLKQQENRIELIARLWKKQFDLLYLDEFYVADIGDAMILANLIEQLFAQGIILITNSNSQPEDLYLNGLQRQRFLPTIELLNKHLQVIHLDSGHDYRLHLLARGGLYNTPANAATENLIQNTFNQLSMGGETQNELIEINKRQVKTMRKSGNIVLFAFNELCGFGRATKDYIEISLCYQTIMVAGIPVFSDNDDLARRFINMIDTFYDNRVIFLCTADAEPNQLYQGGKLQRDFQRTAGRLFEMQSESYLAHGHYNTNEKTN